MEKQIVDLVDFVANNSWLQKLRSERFGVILPNGWFGKPFDNQHCINNIEVVSNHIRIVFDDVRVIDVFEPRLFEIQAKGPSFSSLKLSGIREVVFSWIPYGEESTGKTIVTKFNELEGNTLELVGYFPVH